MVHRRSRMFFLALHFLHRCLLLSVAALCTFRCGCARQSKASDCARTTCHAATMRSTLRSPAAGSPLPVSGILGPCPTLLIPARSASSGPSFSVRSASALVAVLPLLGRPRFNLAEPDLGSEASLVGRGSSRGVSACGNPQALAGLGKRSRRKSPIAGETFAVRETPISRASGVGDVSRSECAQKRYIAQLEPRWQTVRKSAGLWRTTNESGSRSLLAREPCPLRQVRLLLAGFYLPRSGSCAQ